MASDYSKTRVLAFDPGLKGGIAIFDVGLNSLRWARDIPLRRVKYKNSSKSEVDLNELRHMMNIWRDSIALCVIEKVHSAPRDTPKTAFSFGKSYGELRGLMAAFDIPTIFAEPGVWKSTMNLSANKAESIALARAKFPGHDFPKSKDGRAEAALLTQMGVSLVKKSLSL